jgi:hypothetical protein
MSAPTSLREFFVNTTLVHNCLLKLSQDDRQKLLVDLQKILPPIDPSLSIIKNSLIAAKDENIVRKIQEASVKYLPTITKEQLRPHMSERVTALDLSITAYCFAQKLEVRLFKENQISIEKIQGDAQKIASVFTPRASVERFDGVIQERTATKKDLARVEAIIINGNNDLRQVLYVVELYNAVSLFNPDCKVFISGFGGHATSPGVIFGKTEAETIAQVLVDSGVPLGRIVIEKEATNTGENIRFVVEKLKKEPVPPKHLLICGTPAALLRQTRSFEKQACYEWQSLLSFPPQSLAVYYQTEQESLMNMICSLREVTSFLDYTLNTNFITSRLVSNPEGLSEAILIAVEYHNYLNKLHKISNKRALTLRDKFLEFCELKAQNISNDQLKAEIKEIQQSMVDFFRMALAQIEGAWVKVLSDKLSPQRHRQLINDSVNQRECALDLAYESAEQLSSVSA